MCTSSVEFRWTSEHTAGLEFKCSGNSQDLKEFLLRAAVTDCDHYCTDILFLFDAIRSDLEEKRFGWTRYVVTRKLGVEFGFGEDFNKTLESYGDSVIRKFVLKCEGSRRLLLIQLP